MKRKNIFTSWESNHKITLPSAATNTARSYESFQSNVNRFSRMSSYHNNRKIYFRHSYMYLASGRPFFLYAFWDFSIIRLPFPKFRIHCTCIWKGTYYLHDIKRSELYRLEIQQLLGLTKRGPCPQAPVSSKC